MCSRYTIADPTGLRDRFGLHESSGSRIRPRYNVAPTQGVPIVVETDIGRVLRAAAWGFRPVWARDDPLRPPPINARAETIATNGLFRDALARRRCIIPADGYYAWLAQPREMWRQPVRIRLRDGGLFGFAGLFTGPRDRLAEDATCAIVTTVANALVAPIDDRMPVILRPEDEARWLDPALRDPSAVLSCLRPYPSDLMAHDLVDPRLNSPFVDDADLIVPLSAEEQGPD